MKISEIIIEGARDAKEIGNITSEIINFVSENNFPIVNRIAKRNNGDYHFNKDVFSISGVALKNQYDVLDSLIKSNLSFWFVNNIKNSYFSGDGGGQIRINHPSKNFISTLKYNIESSHDLRDLEDGSFSKEDCIKILKISVGASYRRIIAHEIQHALDYLKSKGKYTSDLKSKNYYKKLISDPRDINSKDMSQKEYLTYLNLPHEYWARFTEYVADNSPYFFTNPFDKVLKDFKDSNIIRFNSIKSSKDKRRLLKAIYKVWEDNKKSEK